MAKKKSQFAKRNANIRKTALICGVIAILAVTLIIGIFMFRNSQRAWAVEYNGERLHRAELEYFVFLTARSLEIQAMQEAGQFIELFDGNANNPFESTDFAVAEAMNEYLQTLALLSFAQKNNITLSPHLHNAAVELAEEFVEFYEEVLGRRHRLDFDRLVEFNSVGFLIEELFEALHQTAEIDMEEFEEFFAEEWEENRWAFADMIVSYFIAPSILEVNEFLALVEGGMTFHEALDYMEDNDEDADDENLDDENEDEVTNDENDEYNEYLDSEANYEDEDNNETNNANEAIAETTNETNDRSLDFLAFVQIYGLQSRDDSWAVYELNEGEISHVLAIAHGWFAVVYMERFIDADEEEARELVLEHFESETQAMHVWTLIGDYMDRYDDPAYPDYSYRINDRAVRSINVRRLLGR